MNVRNLFADATPSRLRGAILFSAAILFVLVFAGSAFAQPWTLTVQANTTNTDDVEPSPEAGTVTPDDGTTVQDAEAVTFTATANSDYRFSHWVIGATTYPATNPYGANTVTVIVTADTTATAHFDRASHIALVSEPSDTRVDHPLAATVELRFEDESVCQNAASLLYLDIGRESGRPGAIMSDMADINPPLGVDPGPDGSSLFTCTIDRLGNNYTVEGYYPIVYDGILHYYYTYDYALSTPFDIISEDGTVLGWGYNQYGQVGNDADDLGFPGPYMLAYPHFDNSISIGWWGPIGDLHSWFVRDWYYPVDTDDQGLDHYQAYQVDGMAFDGLDYQAVSAGQYHSVAIGADGSLIAWGDNAYGQLGDGTNDERHLPVTVPLTDVMGVAAGLSHSVAVRSDGTVWAWGRNHYGQLGNDSTTNSNTPVQVHNLTHIVAVSAGDSHSLALHRDGSVWAWGFNADGELGDGTTTHRYEPVQIPAFKVTYFTGHTDDVRSVAHFSSGGTEYVLTASADNTAALWNADTGVRIRTFDDAIGGGAHAHADAVNSVDVYVDGTDWYVLTASTDRTVKLWNGNNGLWVRDYVDTGASLTTAHGGRVNAAVFSPDGTQILTGSVDRIAKLWNRSTGALVHQFIDPALAALDPSETDYNRTHRASVNDVLFTPDGTQIVTASADKTAKLWDAVTGDLDWSFVDAALTAENLGKSHTGSVTSVAYYSDGVPAGTRRLVTGSADHGAKLWDAAGGGLGDLLETFESFDIDDYQHGHSAAVMTVAISSDGARVVTGSRDMTVRRWVTATGEVDVVGDRRSIYLTHDGWVNDLVLAEGDANKIISGSNDDVAKYGQTPGVIKIDAGAFHNLAVKEDKTAWSWGYNNNGQLGIGDVGGVKEDQHSPVQVKDTAGTGFLTDIVEVSAGNAHSLALDDTGMVWGWGYNRYGEVGDTTATERTTPVQVEEEGGGDLSNIVAISAGWGYSLARDGVTGTMYGWGHNHHGQLGNDEGFNDESPGASADRLAAIEITDYQPTYRWDEDYGAVWDGNSPMTSISAGYWHSLAIRTTQDNRSTLSWTVDQDEGGFVTKGTSPQTGVVDQALWTFNADGSGSVVADLAAVVNVQAVARPGFRFDHWSGNFAGSDPEQTWTAGTSIVVVAHFVREVRQFELVIDFNPVAGGTATGAGTYDENTEVDMLATPAEGYRFSHWTGDPEIENSTINPERVRMTEDKTIVAHFEALPVYDLTVNIDPVGAGGVVLLPPGGSYYEGSVVELTAAPAEPADYVFDSWSGDLTGSTNPETITIDEDKEVTAHFTAIYTLTVESTPLTGAVVTGTHAGTTDYSEEVLDGTAIDLTAPATMVSGDDDYTFDHWTLNGVDQTQGEANLVFTFGEDTTVVAVYVRTPRSLDVQSTPVTGVSITGSPAGTTDYATTVGDNLEVNIDAPATFAVGNTDYTFVRWVLNTVNQADGVTNLTFDINVDSTAVAEYEIDTWTLDVESNGASSVVITGTHGGTTDYSETVDDNTEVTLTAPFELASEIFVNWTVNTVDQPEDQTSVTFNINEATTAVANYVPKRTLTVQSTPVTGVSITGTHSGTTNYSTVMRDGTAVSLIAPATYADGDTDYTFVRWVLDTVDQPDGLTTLDFSIGADSTAVAVYEIVRRTLTVQTTPLTGTSITGTPSGTSNYVAEVDDNSEVNVIAPANLADGDVDYELLRWSVGGVDQPVGQLNATFHINEDTTVIATYQIIPRTLTVESTPATGLTILGLPAGTTNYSEDVDDNSVVNLTAPELVNHDGTDYGFAVWRVDGVDLTANQRTISLTMHADTTAIAIYRIDYTTPFVTAQDPAVGSIQAPRDTRIQLDVVDTGDGVDYQTVTIEVEGDLIYDGASETAAGEYDSTGDAQDVRGVCYRIGTPGAYTFIFQAVNMFDYEQTLDVTVNAADLSDNQMVEDDYSFVTVMRQFGGNARVNTTSSDHDRPATTIDDDDNILVVWDQTSVSTARDVYFGMLEDGESSFNASVAVVTESGNQQNPAIAYHDGSIEVGAQDDSDGNWDVGGSSSTNGINWSGGSESVPGNQTNIDIAINSSGRIYVVWQDDRAGNWDIRLGWTDTGEPPLTEVAITSDTAAQTEPAIVIDENDVVYVVWTDARNQTGLHGTDLYAADSANGPWTNVRLTDSASNQSSAAVAAQMSDEVLHLVWVDDANGNSDIFYAATTAGLTGAPLTGVNIVDDNSGAAQLDPDIAIDTCEIDVFVCWEDYRNGATDPDIYFAETGSPFGTNILVNDDSGTARQIDPAIGVDGGNRPYMVWADEREGDRHIYYCGSGWVSMPILSEGGASGLIDAASGGTVEVQSAGNGGTDGVVDSAIDARVDIPAGALTADTEITIRVLNNPPAPLFGQCGTVFEIGPSGLEFLLPVTITLPHTLDDCDAYASFYIAWFNPDTGQWSTEGISNVTHNIITPTLHTVSFQTTHLTAFGASGRPPSGGGGGGGGGGTWCFIATAAYDEGAGEACITPESLLKLNTLRAFRDEMLLPAETGRRFTGWYYALSPYLADRIQERPQARQLVRLLVVDPLAATADKIVRDEVE